MWDKRYSGETYAYGTKANDFLVSMGSELPIGKVLCLAEGEGRNAVWLAQQGHDVTAVDLSAVGLKKAQLLAKNNDVKITTIHADLAEYDIGIEQWDAIILIFCHLPPPLREKVHNNCVAGLRHKGLLLLEAYTPQQLTYQTGGPPNAAMMMDSDILNREFNGLNFISLEEKIRNIHEGECHNGTGAVVQAFAEKI